MQGHRVMHCFDSLAMAWTGALMRRRLPLYCIGAAHGAYQGRSRDNALCVVDVHMDINVKKVLTRRSSS